MEETTQLLEPYSILSTPSRADDRARVLKQGESFAVFDHGGAIRPVGLGEMGLFHEGTRFLSGFELFLENQRPLPLSSTVRADNALIVDLANPDLRESAGGPLPRNTIHIFGAGFLWEGAWYARFRIHNYGLAALDPHVAIRFAADYADIFEIRGTRRERRGRRLDAIVGRGTAVLGYEGLDGRTRRTRLAFSPSPAELTDSLASFRLHLPPRGEQTLDVTVAFESGREEPRIAGFNQALERSTADQESRRACRGSITTSNERFNEWLERSSADLRMMTTATPHGLYPYAGVPWFSAAFGRDGLLTAYETLWLDPQIARGVLSFLAAHQAEEVIPEQEAEPGKILHELRQGEMAALGEVPFGRYYGSADATPLFVVLAGAWYQRTGDRAFIASLWPHIERALGWIDDYGDLDGDGFVEISQGWKNPADAVFHRDGTPAEGPIALCEVQGYVYAARRAAADLARTLDKPERAAALDRQAEELRDLFEKAFWSEDLSIYCLALDGHKNRCEVRASNAGHCLFSGIASPQRGWRVTHTLLNESFFSGWGVRTLEASEARYNPMSYHNGSVWPHDNALIALGMSRYGRKDGAVKILEGLFAASPHFELHRLPELFCGFRQRAQEGPTLYPLACAPQACAAGAVFLLLQACLGLEIDAPGQRVCFNGPELPASLGQVTIRNLQVGGASLDLCLQRHEKDVGVHLDRREGDVEVVVVK